MAENKQKYLATTAENTKDSDANFATVLENLLFSNENGITHIIGYAIIYDGTDLIWYQMAKSGEVEIGFPYYIPEVVVDLKNPKSIQELFVGAAQGRLSSKMFANLFTGSKDGNKHIDFNCFRYIPMGRAYYSLDSRLVHVPYFVMIPNNMAINFHMKAGNSSSPVEAKEALTENQNFSHVARSIKKDYECGLIKLPKATPLNLV